FATRALGRLIISEFAIFFIRYDPARIKSADLTDQRFHPWIARGDKEYVTARIAGTANADALLVYGRFAHRPVDDREPVGQLLHRVNVFAQLLDLCRNAAA